MIMLVPFDGNMMEDTMFSLYSPVLSRCRTEVSCVTARCIYEWLFSWMFQQPPIQQPFTPEQKTANAGRFDRPRHFFSAQKLNMRNAP